jgi:hypothetical protein
MVWIDSVGIKGATNDPGRAVGFFLPPLTKTVGTSGQNHVRFGLFWAEAEAYGIFILLP